MEAVPRTLVLFKDEDGKYPYSEWLKSLRDKTTRAKITIRVNRLLLGNFGDCKQLDQDVYELRIHIGSGYRVYFLKDENRIVVLLTGGDKATQKTDIKTAQKFAKQYRSQQTDG